MTVSLGYSPCPNDTFLFYAMVHDKIDTEGLTFDVELGDVEALNQKAFAAQLDITKISYHAMAYLLEDYVLLNAGSALGNNCGPLLIAKNKIPLDAVDNCTIAIPGKYTTANLLLSLAFPKAQKKQEMVFSDIETAVLAGKVDAGLIIHENRFTYEQKGLVKLIDLGEYWEQKTQLPIPLGGIAIKRSLPGELHQKINRVLRRSVEYALQNPDHTKTYVSAHAQEMEEEVLQQHIALYVNNYTVDLGKKGKKAVEELFTTGWKNEVIPLYDKNIFI